MKPVAYELFLTPKSWQHSVESFDIYGCFDNLWGRSNVAAKKIQTVALIQGLIISRSSDLATSFHQITSDNSIISLIFLPCILIKINCILIGSTSRILSNSKSFYQQLRQQKAFLTASVIRQIICQCIGGAAIAMRILHTRTLLLIKSSAKLNKNQKPSQEQIRNYALQMLLT